jgi:hypothetical protein
MEFERPGRLDRQLQLRLLHIMRDSYPSAWRQVPPDIGTNDEVFYFNILYLEEHGLCKTNITTSAKGQRFWGNATITAKGIDFLEDDGGLSAILGVVTVRLEADTVRKLIAEKIEKSDLPSEEKAKWKGLVSGLSDTSLRAATSDIIHIGIQHIPNVVELLRSLV